MKLLFTSIILDIVGIEHNAGIIGKISSAHAVPAFTAIS